MFIAVVVRIGTHEALADLALVEPALSAAEGHVVHLLVTAMVARLAVRAARRGRWRCTCSTE